MVHSWSTTSLERSSEVGPESVDLPKQPTLTNLEICPYVLFHNSAGSRCGFRNSSFITEG